MLTGPLLQDITFTPTSDYGTVGTASITIAQGDLTCTLMSHTPNCSSSYRYSHLFFSFCVQLPSCSLRLRLMIRPKRRRISYSRRLRRVFNWNQTRSKRLCTSV